MIVNLLESYLVLNLTLIFEINLFYSQKNLLVLLTAINHPKNPPKSLGKNQFSQESSVHRNLIPNKYEKLSKNVISVHMKSFYAP